MELYATLPLFVDNFFPLFFYFNFFIRFINVEFVMEKNYPLDQRSLLCQVEKKVSSC